MKEPTITETAFDCPHCGAYTTQYWHNAYAKFIRDGAKKPFIPPDDFRERVNSAKGWDGDMKAKLIQRFERVRAKLLFIDDETDYGDKPQVHNLFLSECYNCKKWAVWVNEDLVYPSKKYGALPNQDLPEPIRAVVDEARQILDCSPKGAAALLRLAVQMLCIHLGKPGKDLNADIAALVTEGLNPIVQKSLDVVRVIGNESVHAGTIDLNDDRETAVRLFDLINIICEQMITQPRQVEELYQKLPETKREAVAKRDSPKKV